MVGPIVAIDEQICQLQTGSDSPEMMAAWLGMSGVDFDIGTRRSWLNGCA